jgi:S-(hydroxymethyl)glutathione dehydrogenase/alcohol dehydrogenase
MRSAVLTKINAPLSIMEMEPAMHTHDSPCANGQVLVEVICSGICGSQLKEINGEKGNAGFLPHCMGHEGAGIVKKVGAGVNIQMIGKKVVMHWRKGAGPEAYLPARYETSHGVSIGGGHVTTLATHAVVSANRLTVVPNDVPNELCALLGCGLSTALGTIEQEASVKFGESVLIVGCGGVGLNLIQAASLACAYPIVATDIADKRETAKRLGAFEFHDAKRGFAGLRDICPRGFDVIVDTTGNVEALEGTIPLIAEGGRYVCIGQTKPQENFRVLSAVNMFHREQGSRIIWSQGGGFRPSEMIPRYVNLWRNDRLNMKDIVSHRIGLDEINDGIDLVRSGQAGRIMVMMK